MSTDAETVLQRAEHALEAEDSPRAVARYYAAKADKAGCFTDLVGLLREWGPGEADDILLDQALEKRQNGGADKLPNGNRPSVPLSDLYSHLEGSGLTYDLRPYTAPDRFILLSAPPKRGKSTFATLYAHAKATGGSFIGQNVEPGRVLYVAPDENWRDVVRRFRSFGTPGDTVEVWRDRSRSVAAIAARAEEIAADLVVLDTLLRVAGISDENDNAEWDRWFGETRDHVHGSGAVWFAVHHDRKSGGKDGEGIRGASAIFGSVDVAISLQTTEEHERRRVLRVEGSRLDTADPLVIELDADNASYTAVGEARVVSILEDASLDRLRSVLTDLPAPVSSIYDTLRDRYPEAEGDVAESTVRLRLKKLATAGLAQRSGEGGKRDPYKYSLSCSTESDKETERDTEAGADKADTRSGANAKQEPDTAAEIGRSVVQHPKGTERLSESECLECRAFLAPWNEECPECGEPAPDEPLRSAILPLDLEPVDE